MPLSEEYDRIKASALRYLANREHSQYELRNKLSKKFDSIESIQSVITELADSGYQSDQRFIESFIRSKVSRGYGPNLIEYELRQHGIPSLYIDRCYHQNQIVWRDKIAALYKKKFTQADSLDSQKKQKIIRFFRRKGFDADMVLQYLKHQ